MANLVLSVIEAVQHGDLKYVKQHVGSMDRNTESTTSLLDANTCDTDKCSLLHWACINNRVDIATFLVEQGADVNSKGGVLNETPLQWACRSESYGFTHLIQFLLRQDGINLHHKSTEGFDAVHIALRAGNLNVLLLLLIIGRADVNSVDSEGNTALMHLIKSGKLYSQHFKDIFRLFLALDADVSLRDHYGNTIVHLWSKGRTLSAEKGTLSFYVDTALLQSVLEAGGKSLLSLKNDEDESASDIATRVGNHNMVPFLREWDQYVNLPYSVPTISTAVGIWAVYMSLYYMKWYALAPILPISFLWHRFAAQTAIPLHTSRLPFGFAWGTIFTIWHCTTVYTFPHDYEHISLMTRLALFVNGIIICITLYLTAATRPQRASRATRDSKICHNVVERIADNGSRDGINSRPVGEAFSNIKKTSKKLKETGNLDVESGESSGYDNCCSVPPRLCVTCLLDRGDRYTHCGQCNSCQLDLDHHCPFVNNCVGRGNRRVFVLFCLSASLGCLFAFVLLLQTEYTKDEQCSGITLSRTARTTYSPVPSLLLQCCIFYYRPDVLGVSILAILVSIWIFTVYAQQISFIASETTTVDIMRKGSSTYDSNSDTIDYPGAYKGLTRSATNLIAFFRAGDYIVKTEKLSTGYLLGRSDSATHQGCSGCYQWLVFGASKLQKHRN
jgi:ankyrin repeat protein